MFEILHSLQKNMSESPSSDISDSTINSTSKDQKSSQKYKICSLS